jgi:UDP-N-acetylglucosamine acyltransferase
VISNHAIVHPDAKLGKNVSVGPGSVIGPGVEIGDDTWIGPHVVIQGPTLMGKNNKVFQFASVGDEPQDITYHGEPTRLEIGDNNVIREYCMISRGTVKGGSVTKIGHQNYLMAHTHIGHDCHVDNHIIMVNYSALSGHVTVQDYATIGAYAAVHQFCHIGSYAFIARATYVTKDVLPYLMIAGHDAGVCGINTVGLKRRGFSSAQIDVLRRAYKIIFRKGLTVQQALEELMQLEAEHNEVDLLIDTLRDSSRGIVR